MLLLHPHSPVSQGLGSRGNGKRCSRGCPELEEGGVMGWGGGLNWDLPEKSKLGTDFLNQGQGGWEAEGEPV